jgi:acetyl esterase/lipase
MLHRFTFPAAVVCLTLLTTGVLAQQEESGSETASAAIEQRIENWLRRQDQDDDGRISEDEATGLMKANFARIDANQDGVLDGDELRGLSERLQRSTRPQANTQRQGQQTMSTRQLLSRAPEGVVIEPDIAYRDGDSNAWRLDLVRPENAGDSPRPGLVFVHGGGWRSGDKRAGTFLNGALEYAQLGYVCITVNYRLIDEAPFPACIEDVKNAVRWFRAHADQYSVDPERIGGYGNSAGAHLVCMLGLAGPDAGLEGDGPYQEQSSLLQAVCASATPTCFLIRPETLERRGRSGQLFGGSSETLEERARQASPITYAAATAPPMLLFHGTADRTVDVAHSDRFTQALKEAGADDVTYLRIEDAGHGVFNQHGQTTKPAMREFFDRTIGTGSLTRADEP